MVLSCHRVCRSQTVSFKLLSARRRLDHDQEEREAMAVIDKFDGRPRNEPMMARALASELDTSESRMNR